MLTIDDKSDCEQQTTLIVAALCKRDVEDPITARHSLDGIYFLFFLVHFKGELWGQHIKTEYRHLYVKKHFKTCIKLLLLLYIT